MDRIKTKKKGDFWFVLVSSGRKGYYGKGIQNESTIKKRRSGIHYKQKENFLSILFWIILAAWPSGKAEDCKSFFPSSNPGVA